MLRKLPESALPFLAGLVVIVALALWTAASSHVIAIAGVLSFVVVLTIQGQTRQP